MGHDTEELKAVQRDLREEERERSRKAERPAQRKAAARRAEKADYLERKLEEQARSERDEG